MKTTAEDVLTGDRVPILYDADDHPLVRAFGFQPPRTHEEKADLVD